MDMWLKVSANNPIAFDFPGGLEVKLHCYQDIPNSCLAGVGTLKHGQKSLG